MKKRAEFTWTDDMQLADFVTGFMEAVVPHGEQGALRIDGVVNGRRVEILLTMELLGVKEHTS